MTEYAEGIQWSVGILLTLIYATCWWIGGRPGGRLWRRWIAPLVFSIGLVALSLWLGRFSWWYLIGIAAYKAVTHIGYGGESFAGKFIRRLVWSVLYCACAVIYPLISGAWLIFGIQCAFSLTAAIVFGVVNPFKSSPKEEASIVFASSFLVPTLL